MTDDMPVRPPAEVIIGLDVGTTATKVVAFGLGSAWHHAALREYPLLHPAPGWQVQDPQTILTAVWEALADCAAGAGDAEVVAISVSSGMHGLIGLDADMRPLTSLLTWADARSRDEARWLRNSGQALHLHRTSGTPVHPMSPLTKLMWFARHEPELCARVRWWAGLKDYLLWALTGTLVTELSSASGTGLLDLRTRSWNPAALDLAGISTDQLPPILDPTAALRLATGPVARMGLPTAPPVVMGAGDGPLSNLGIGAMEPGVVGLSLGTSGAVRMAVPEPAVDPEGRLFCYALTDKQWVLGGAVSTGGVVLRWAGDVFGRDLAATGGGVAPDAELLELAATVPAGSDGLVMLPYLLAERAPLWDPDLRGAFLGMRHSHTRGQFVRAAVEGVSLHLSTIVDQLNRIEPVVSVRATGGVFRSDLWGQVMAAVLGRPLLIVRGAEGSALGAAALGLFALGRADTLTGAATMLTTPDQGSEPPVVQTSPADAAVYDRIRAGVSDLLGAYDQAARLFEQSSRARERGSVES
jgi:gluconokinase